MSELIVFDCPFCGRHLDAPRESSGLDGRCPACGQGITIPAPYERPGQKEETGPIPDTTSVEAEDSVKSSTVRIDTGHELNLPKAKPRVLKIRRKPGS